MWLHAMTARAKELTSDARPSTSPRELRPLLAALELLEYDIRRLTADSGLNVAELGDPDAVLPCETYGALVASAQRQRAVPNLALTIAERVPIGAYPLLDYLVVLSETVGAGVAELGRYLRLTGNPVSIAIDDAHGDVRVVMDGPSASFAEEYLAALMILHLKAETGGAFRARAIAFRHVPDDPSDYAAKLDCLVEAPASWSGVSISRDSWHLPLSRRDPVLRHLLQEQADAALARLPSRAGTAREVQRALTASLMADAARLAQVSQRLGMSARTLQRRLAAEGVSFDQLLEEARKEAAARYLCDSTLAIGEIGYLLGYSEPAAFHRAFRRWYGLTPDAFRRDARRSAI